jgi:hypothetical protein
LSSAKQRNIDRNRHRALRPGVEYEFDEFTLPRDLSRSVVTSLLAERAEQGGWELDRVRIAEDGIRRIILRRKIIRQNQLLFWYAS